jgi:hypothetical protein
MKNLLERKFPMRCLLRLALCGALAAPTLVSAQEQPQNEEQQGGGETEGKEVVPPPEKAPAQGKEAAPGEVHTVVKGDTLWDLSQHYLGSPWYWPKVWSYNPEIANPHWIYPGNQVRFFPSGEEVPSRVEVGDAPNETPPDEGEDVAASDAMGDDEGVHASGKIGYVPSAGTRLVHQSFVTQKEVDEAGVIVGSFSEATMLSYPDTAYVQFKNKGNVKTGDKVVIFRTAEEIEHPVKGGRVGYMTLLIGTMKIVRVSDRYVTGLINRDCWDEVHRGDLIGPYTDRFSEVVANKPNDRELKGYIISSQVSFLALLGEHQIVVVDKGSADGVQQGNTFTVVRRQDPTVSVDTFVHPSQSIDETLPVEDIGTCVAVDVKDRASMCLLTRTLRDLEKGDRVEMRVPGSRNTTASR